MLAPVSTCQEQDISLDNNCPCKEGMTPSGKSRTRLEGCKIPQSAESASSKASTTQLADSKLSSTSDLKKSMVFAKGGASKHAPPQRASESQGLGKKQPQVNRSSVKLNSQGNPPIFPLEYSASVGSAELSLTLDLNKSMVSAEGGASNHTPPPRASKAQEHE